MLISRQSLAIALGLSLAIVSALRLLCAGGAPAMSLATACRWLPCAAPQSLAAAEVAALEGDAPAPAELLLRSPASPQRWLAVSRLLLLQNDPARAGLCVERSVALAPRSPPVLLEAAAFFYATGQAARGLALMSRVLAATRDYDSVIFALYDRAGSVAAVLRQGLPRDPPAARSYLLHLLGQRDSPGARLAWAWLGRRGFADRTLLRRYLLYLIDNHLCEEAARVFDRFLPPAERAAGGNRIAHGGFESESTGVPLDWVVTAVPHVEARRDQAAAREGSWSLRLAFDGQANVEYRHVAQQAVVSPGRWKLQAWIRTQGLSSDQGIGLRILEASPTPAWQVWTENVSGDSDWKRVEATIQIPAAVHLAQIEIVRRPSRKLDNKLGGIAWIDQVSLTPLVSGMNSHQPQRQPTPLRAASVNLR
jgi:hypothetical protein